MYVLSLCVIALTTIVFLTWLLNITPFSLSRRKAKKLPPGPWSIPVIGSLHHVLCTLPHRRMMEMSHRHEPLMFLRLGELPTIVVSSAEAAALIMKTHDLAFAHWAHSVTLDIFSSGGIGLTFAPYGEHWRQLRKACVAALLTAKQVKRLEGIRAQEVGKLLHSITKYARDGAVINLSHKFSMLSNNISSRAMFSDRCSQQEVFLHAMDKVVALLGSFAIKEHLEHLFSIKELLHVVICLSNFSMWRII